MRLSRISLVGILAVLLVAGCAQDRNRFRVLRGRGTSARPQQSLPPVDRSESYDTDPGYSDPVPPIPPEPEFRAPSSALGVSRVKSVGFLRDVGSRMTQPFRAGTAVSTTSASSTTDRCVAPQSGCSSSECGSGCSSDPCAAPLCQPEQSRGLLGDFVGRLRRTSKEQCGDSCVKPTACADRSSSYLHQFLHRNRRDSCGSECAAENGCGSAGCGQLGSMRSPLADVGDMRRPQLAELLPDPFVSTPSAMLPSQRFETNRSQQTFLQQTPHVSQTPADFSGSGTPDPPADYQPGWNPAPPQIHPAIPGQPLHAAPVVPSVSPQPFVEPPQWPGRQRTAAADSAKSVSWSNVRNWRGPGQSGTPAR
ncbi:MAG: hypothetical protein KDA85_13515 [Planctomycetaceae bacterium]|nr:hypothetical protein [Planctomycetaceae bacterium]